jgi:hypothetical protein
MKNYSLIEMEECFVHVNIADFKKKDIREVVCSGSTEYKHDNGHFYCLFHLPEDHKDKIKFKKIYDKRILEGNYNFQGVYFPIYVFLDNRRFESQVDFSFATFTGDTDFDSAVFNDWADFSSAIFKKMADFRKARFNREVDFTSTKFEKNVDFNEVVFSEKVNFHKSRFNFSERKAKENNQQSLVANFAKSKFYKEVDFRTVHFFQKSNFYKAEFCKETSFRNAKFYKSTCFKWVSFAGDTYFDKCRFRNYVDFGSSIFASNSDIFFRKSTFYNHVNFEYVTFGSYLTFESYKRSPIFNDESFVSFQNVRNESTAKVIFNQLCLRPCWFIHADSRNYIFNDVQWKFVSNNRLNKSVQIELNNISKLEIEKKKIHLTGESTIPKSLLENPKTIFKITCRQLAENAEKDNRYEEASNFRRMAFETEWLERKEKISNWIKNLVPESEKLKRRFSGSIREEDRSNPPINTFGILRSSGDFIIHWLYRITSFYGESWSWATFVLLTLILIIFPFIFTQTNYYVCDAGKTISQEKNNCEPRMLSFGEGMRQSLATATLQNVDSRKPNSPASETFTILEKIFAPLQAALLALAIRRKFMR